MKTKQYAIFLLIVGMIAVVSMGSVSAAVGDKFVNGTGGSDTNNGDSWATAYQTIQKGLDNVATGGILNIASGNYSGTGNTNLTVKNSSITINGSGEGKTIIDGNGTNHGLTVNSSQNVTVKDLTIQNSNGSAINNSGNLTVADVTFKNNTAVNGGAIYNTGNASITGSTFVMNNASVNGSAIYNTGNASNLTVKYSRFVNNSLSDVFVNNGTVNATLNWWGTNFNGTNPLAAGRIGVNATNAPNVSYAPWLILSINAKPSTIYEGGFSVVAADLYTDSNGVNHRVDAALYPKEIPVTFTTDRGSLKYADTVLNHGFGDAIFVPGNNVGIANVSAQVDSQNVTTQVLVKETPKPIIKVTHKVYTIVKIVKIKSHHKIIKKVKIIKITITKITIIRPHIEPAPL